MSPESVQLPNRGHFNPEGTASRQKSLFQRYAGRIGMGIVCSGIATGIYNIAPIKKAVLYACSAAVHIGGDPISGDGGIVDKAEQKLKDIEKKIGEKVESRPHLPVGLPAGSPLHKSPEQLQAEADLKEARRKQQEESERKSIMAKLQSMGVPFDSEGSIEKLRVELADAKDMLRKRPLLERADKMGLHADPKEPYDVLEARVKDAENDAEYRELYRQYERNLEWRKELLRSGPNARCPNRACSYQFHTKRKDGEYRCSRCRAIWSIAQARACMPPPPMPLPPKRTPSLMDRLKGVFGR
jgi:hypothetical protein